ncbi:tight junction ZO-1-like [Brachionus plicatilis]|uniref:Tight junction ZO-1-like n=1 Tax=Brachionus plicatilis TaxID=10195 RepID=A0A3M7RHC5_BRAPC|nr:tight junction ZO-1-like [Brachionus plicatilis]
MQKLDQQMLNQQHTKTKHNPYFLWEQHNITLIKSQNFGYGIAISGGLTNTNQDSSIYVSDIVPGGPAENKLLVDDILLSVNGVNVENVEHGFVIRLLKEAKDFIHLVIKRKIKQQNESDYIQNGCEMKRHNIAIQQTAATVMSNYQNNYQTNLHSASSNSTSTTDNSNQNLMSIMMNSTQSLSSMKPIKVQLNRKEKKELFGIVLGCKFYIKDIMPHSLAAQETNLKKGDILLKLNDLNTDQISLLDANKILSKYKDNKLNLVIKRNGSDDEDESGQGAKCGDGASLTNHSVDSIRPEINGDNERQPNHGCKFFSNKNIVLQYRSVVFARENGIGIRLAGGNKVGIFICDVQYNSPAERAGLKIGDKIIKVNGVDYTCLTREEAVQHILNIQNMVEMIVANSPEEYEPNAFDPLGADSFYIRTHFNCSSKSSTDLTFRINDILHVTDTLYNGVIGQWVASRLDKSGEAGEEAKGTVPNKVNAEQLVQTAPTIEQLYSTSEKSNEPVASFSLGASARMSIRMKLSGRNTLSKRSKSASRSSQESEQSVCKVSKANTFYSNKFTAYEKVVLKEVSFVRPIVIFGPLADVAREKLKSEFPSKFEIPESYSTESDSAQSSGVIKLASIKTIIEKGRHCLLDITPNAVDHLNYAQYYPICIYLKAQSRNHCKELRQKYAKNLKTKSSKRLYDNSAKLETYYAHLFTATIQLESNQWFKKLKEAIESQQTQPIWISQESELKAEPRSECVEANGQSVVRPVVKAEPKQSKCVFDDNFEFPIYTTAQPTISGAASTYSLYEENNFNRRSLAASDTDQQTNNLHNESFSHIYSTNFNKPCSSFHQDDAAINRVKSESNLSQDLFVKAQVTYANTGQNYQLDNQEENWKKFATISANTVKSVENGSGAKSVNNTPVKSRPSLNENSFSDQFKRLSTTDSGYKLIKNSQSSLMPNSSKNVIDQQLTNFDSENNLLLKPIAKSEMDHVTKQLFKQELDNKIKNDLKCKTNSCMKVVNGSDGMTLRRGQKDSPSRPPPPILPKPKFILPPTSTTNLVLQRNLKSKSELNIATQSNFSSSSAACSSSSSASSASSHTANDIEPESKSAMAKSNTFQQQKPRNKILENNSLISSSQGYQSDTWESHSSRQSFDMDNQYGSKYSQNLIKPIQEIKKLNNGSCSSDDTENENAHFKKKSILVQKADSSSSSSTVSSGSNSSSSAVGLSSSATISDESSKKRASYETFEMPHIYQTNCPTNEINSSNSFFYSRSNQKFSDLYANDKTRTSHNTYTAHYNDNGVYRKLFLDSNSNCSIIASANGVFDTNGGILESADTGVSLNVPEGAIANGCSFDLYFKVCHCKSTITNGKGEVLTNPIVMCGPRGIRFLKPIELQIPHFISIDGQSWSYAFKTQDTITDEDDPYNWNANRFHKKTLINSVAVQLESF